MKVISPAFDDGQLIPSIYTCDGENMSPPLEISEVPDEAKSLAVIMFDPDAPGGDFTHWVMWNIPPSTTSIGENEWPEGAEQGLNDGGELGYLGACPPEGVHRYSFRVYALDRMLDLQGEVGKSEIEMEIDECLLDEAELVGIYKLQS